MPDHPSPRSSSTADRPMPMSKRLALVAMVVPIAVGCTSAASAQSTDDVAPIDGFVTAELVAALADGRSLDGSGNNLDDPTLGQAGTPYTRLAEANYADGIGELVHGPDPRYVSNRIFNDSNQNVFSENGVTHWSFVWGQFIDHTIGLRAGGDEDLVIAYDPDDPLEEFTNDLGAITTTRSAAADGTGTGTVRQQTNTVSSYIDAWAVYGGTDERLDRLRAGPVDGDPTNNDASLLLVDGYLPTAEARPDAETPDVDLIGRLMGDSAAAVIAGDVRVNENIGLIAAHTLLAREHNRIVELLPDDLDEQTKFEIAQRTVAALQQYITYNEFLPAMGVELDDYTAYDPTVDPSITNEFATVGYRAHSQIHGEFEAEIGRDEITDDQIGALERGGIDYRRTLAEVIAANSDADLDDLPPNVFLLDRSAGGTGTDATADGDAVADVAVADVAVADVTDGDRRGNRRGNDDRGPRRDGGRRGGRTVVPDRGETRDVSSTPGS